MFVKHRDKKFRIPIYIYICSIIGFFVASILLFSKYHCLNDASEVSSRHLLPDWYHQMKKSGAGLQPAFTKKKKLAFFFQLKDKLTFKRVWNTYFDNIDPELYKIIFHFSSEREKSNSGLRHPHTIIDTIVENTWCGMWPVHRALLKEAIRDVDVFGSVYISDSCLPIKPFHILYKHARNSLNPIVKYVNQQLTVCDHWMYLTRNAMHAMLMYESFIPKVKGGHCQEEEYPPIIFQKAHIPTTFGVVTFGCWKCSQLPGGDANKFVHAEDHPYTFTVLSRALFNKLLNSGSFFARKFNVDSYVRNEDITSSPMLQLIEDELIKILSVQKYKKVFNHYLRVDDKYRLVWGPKK
jgi:hypothetical protein